MFSCFDCNNRLDLQSWFSFGGLAISSECLDGLGFLSVEGELLARFYSLWCHVESMPSVNILDIWKCGAEMWKCGAQVDVLPQMCSFWTFMV